MALFLGGILRTLNWFLAQGAPCERLGNGRQLQKWEYRVGCIRYFTLLPWHVRCEEGFETDHPVYVCRSGRWMHEHGGRGACTSARDLCAQQGCSHLCVAGVCACPLGMRLAQDLRTSARFELDRISSSKCSCNCAHCWRDLYSEPLDF